MRPENFTLRFSSVPLMPWSNIERTEEVLRFGDGLFSKIVTALSRFSRFSYTISFPPDKQWGKKEIAGWTGMMGMLERNESDVALGPFAMNLDRYTVGDFTVLYITNYLTILAGKKDEQPMDMFRSILTFDIEVWAGVLISLLLFTILSVVSERVSSTELRVKHTTHRRSVFHSLNKYFWQYLSSVFCEGNFGTLDRMSSRILVGVWWLAVLVLMNGFSGNLKASLMVKLDLGRIDSIEELVKRTSITPYVHQGTAYETYLKNNQLPEFQKLWAKVESMNSSLNQDRLYRKEVLQQVLLGQAVIVSDVYTMKYYVSKHCRNLTGGGSFYFSKQSFFHHGFTVAISRNLPYSLTRDIKIKSRKIVEAGLCGKWLNDLYRNWSLCSSQKSSQEEKPLALEDCQGIFYLWLMCICASMVAFAFEYVPYCTRKKAKKKKITD